jgi:hypothetical protein
MSGGATITATVGATNLYNCGYLKFRDISITSANGWTFPIVIDGDRHPSAPQGIRSTYLDNVLTFGGQTASMMLKGLVHLSMKGCSSVLAGGTSGDVFISGKSGKPTDTFNIGMVQVGGNLSLNYVNNGTIDVGLLGGNLVLDNMDGVKISSGKITGSLTNTAAVTNVRVDAYVTGGNAAVATLWSNSAAIGPNSVAYT